jgi:hypothetical protein
MNYSKLKRSFEFVFCLASCSFIPLATGCGDSGPEVATVSGTVLQNGKPVPGASITFFPDAGRPSYGVSDATGRYVLEYSHEKPGAVTGSHTVKVMLQGSGPPGGPPSGPTEPGKVSAVTFTAPTEVVLPQPMTVVSGDNQMDLIIP